MVKEACKIKTDFIYHVENLARALMHKLLPEGVTTVLFTFQTSCHQALVSHAPDRWLEILRAFRRKPYKSF